MTRESDFLSAYKKGEAHGNIHLRRIQQQSADKSNVILQIFLGKPFLGQADTPPVAVSVSARADAHVDARTPEQEKQHLVELQKAVWEEARRFEQN